MSFQATVLMSIGFMLLLAFVSVIIYRKMDEIPTCGIPSIVLVSVLCPLLASLAAFGSLCGLGYDLYTIMCVTPFLIAGVGRGFSFPV